MKRSHALCSVRPVDGKSFVGANPASATGQSIVSLSAHVASDVAVNFVGVANAVVRSGAETARAAHFWTTVLAIWGRYKVTQIRAHIAALQGNSKDAARLWKRRHDIEAEVSAFLMVCSAQDPTEFADKSDASFLRLCGASA